VRRVQRMAGAAEIDVHTIARRKGSSSASKIDADSSDES
jgi:hypothetical protein